MVRPKKPRFIDGVELEANLYPDNKGRAGHYRYCKPDGTFKHFTAESVHKANSLAKTANAKRDTYDPTPKIKGKTTLEQLADDYIAKREQESPSLSSKASWKNRKASIKQFAKSITATPARFNRRHVQDWWDTIGYHQRKQRHKEFRLWFSYMMARGVLPNFEYNPFTTADDRPRLFLGDKPAKVRTRLDINGFWKIYHSAGHLGFEGLQIAMGLGLVTFLREGDILSLRTDQFKDNDFMRVIVGKSEAQKGNAKGARLEWDERHALVKDLINWGRELSLKNARCPFLVSHRGERRVKGKTKEHWAQVSKERLAEMFRDARDATDHWDAMKANERPTFHEIRSLSDAMASKSGYDLKQIQHAMAHSDEAMTLKYQEGHDLPFESVEVVFTEKMIGGSFKGGFLKEIK